MSAMRWILLMLVGGLPGWGWSQTFEVIQPSGARSTVIALHRDTMEIRDATAGRLLYLRDPRFDSLDGQYAGYFHPELNRVLRFPRSGRGDMWMADLDDVSPRFQPMTGVLRPTNPDSPPPPGLNHGFFPGGFGPIPSFMPAPLVPAPFVPAPFAPVAPVWGSGITATIGPPPISAYPPIRRRPQSVLIDSQIVAGPPLPPVTVGLRNGSPSDLVVTIVNLKDDSKTEQIKIKPGDVVNRRFSRDSAAEQIETYRVINEFGDVVTRQNSLPLAPEVLYEIVVHQWQVQSIAIDRTGKSPNVIEDIHYQGKGLGRFPLPAGADLQSGVIDVYRAAINQGNPATVAPITTR
ncbi:signal peptide protein [Rhodopirellula maiorica SM1]|uniref:Signal peptide protein n=1 Tax=Rhodopirellula maiorica SM1 TaxID=1265738 RepID=M5RKM7_9BACT|nr:hypothetical protein [Rhodopirellula maiorica]EMI19855.1 signal peptide protein [Rhodopirellula maiorica SM1]